MYCFNLSCLKITTNFIQKMVCYHQKNDCIKFLISQGLDNNKNYYVIHSPIYSGNIFTNFLFYFFRSLGSLPEILYHLTYITQSRYTGALLNQVEFHDKTSLVSLRWINDTNNQLYSCDDGNNFGFGCR